MSHDRSTVEAVVKHYFDGLYEGDADKLGAIFHPTADLRWLEKGELQVLTVPDWLDRVRKRPSAKAEGKPREDFIVTIDRSDDIYRLHQGALPVAAALFHRLSGGDEADRRLADRLEILPLRPARMIAWRPALTSRFSVRMGAMLEARFQIFLILLAVLAGTALLARRFNIAPAILLMLAGIALAFVPGMPTRGTAARTGSAAGAAAADLFGERRDELARIQVQSPPDHSAVGRLRDLHRLRGRRRHALPDRAALERRLPARGHRRPAGRGGAAGDRPQAGHAAPYPRRARGRRACQ